MWHSRIDFLDQKSHSDFVVEDQSGLGGYDQVVQVDACVGEAVRGSRWEDRAP